MAIRSELIEELLAEKDPRGIFAPDGLLDELKEALAERVLNAGMDQHRATERTEAETDGPLSGASTPPQCLPPLARTHHRSSRSMSSFSLTFAGRLRFGFEGPNF
jgi:hypothetical protein